MHYINAVAYVFENMHEYINIWRAVMVPELFHDFCEFANEGSTWKVQ